MRQMVPVGSPTVGYYFMCFARGERRGPDEGVECLYLNIDLNFHQLTTTMGSQLVKVGLKKKLSRGTWN